MFIPLACFPLTIPLVCGLAPGVLLLIFLVPMIAIYATHGNIGSFENNSYDYALIYIATAMVALYFIILGLSVIYFRLETYYDLKPWSTGYSSDESVCPFTDKVVNRRCPSCGCCVNKDAFKHSTNTFLLNFAGQQEPLLWKQAKQSINAVDHVQGRKDLDSLLEFTGNICTLSVSSCCIGCYTWQSCFNIGRRLTLMYALSSLFFAYFPWAFSAFVETIGTLGIVIKVACGVVSHILAASALVIELKSLSRALTFLLQTPRLPRPRMLRNQTKDGIVGTLLYYYSK